MTIKFNSDINQEPEGINRNPPGKSNSKSGTILPNIPAALNECTHSFY